MSGMSNGVVEMHGMSNDVREECCITVMTGRYIQNLLVALKAPLFQTSGNCVNKATILYILRFCATDEEEN